ncbi:MAG: two-component system response regulator, partial [Huintestinicola sp.]
MRQIGSIGAIPVFEKLLGEAAMEDLFGRKYKVLIVDDSDTNRAILAEILRGEYEIIEADSGESALQILQKDSCEISLVLLDVMMPGMDGFEVLERMNRLGIIEELPVIMISAESSPGFITRAYDFGAADYVSRPFESSVVQRRVKNTITLYAKQKRLVDIVAGQIYEKEKNNDLMISILSHIVEFRNGESGSHVIHINIITELLLKQLCKKSSKYDLSMK